MRIREPKVLKGFFWKVFDEQNKYPGVLTISDGGLIELELIVDSPDALQSLKIQNQNIRIIGHVANEGYVTLEECHQFKSNINMKGIHTVWIESQMMVSGLAFDENEEVKIHSMSFTVEDLEEWIGLSGFDKSQHRNQKNNEEIIITYKKLPTKRFALDDDLVLEVVFYAPAFINDFDAAIKQRVRLNVYSETARPLQDLKAVCHRIVDFLSLVMNKPLMIDNVAAEVPIIDRGMEKNYKSNIFYPSTLRPNNPIKQSFGRLFGFKEIENHFADILQKWLLMYDKLEPIYNLYFSVQFGYHQTLNGHFLALAQVLEVFYKRIYGDNGKKTFINKVRFLFEIYFDNKSMNVDFSQKQANELRAWLEGLSEFIKDTRNYLTHYDSEYEEPTGFAKGGDLRFLYNFMNMIFQVHVLKQLGFDDLKIKDFIDNQLK